MKFSKYIIIMFFTVAITSGCTYNWILPEEDVDPNPDGEPISYATQVQPIFDNKCVSCHNTGGTAPDLSTGKSYNQIVPGHVNLTAPAESNIYHFPAPSSTVHTWKKYSNGEAKIVLTWIEEGAKNN